MAKSFGSSDSSVLGPSEVHSWLKSLSPGLKLERLSTQFENRGFRSRRSLAYVKSEDLDAFFPSPDKLLLAERRVLEAELGNIRSGTAPRSTGLEPKRLKMTQNLESNAYAGNSSAQTPDTNFYGGFSSKSESSATQVKTHSSLDRRALEHTENLQILVVQIESAKQQLEKKRKEIEELSDVHERRGKVCATCHKSGHNKARCTNHPCTDVNLCKLKDKHPELQNDIRTLQRDLKELEQKYGKAKNDNDVFLAARQRAKSSFFAVMRPRLKCQNPAKYVDRGSLDRDLMVLQRALQNKVPEDEGLDWRLPGIIEEYKRGNVNVYLNQPNPPQSYDLPSVDTAWPAYNLPDSYYKY